MGKRQMTAIPKVGDTVLLCEENLPLQRAEVLEIDKEGQVLTVCILVSDREPDDEDGLTEVGFENAALLVPLYTGK